MKFFKIFLEFCRAKKSVFSEEFDRIIEFRNNGYAGKGWDEYDPKIGEIIWPIEEASWLRISFNEQKLLTSIGLLLEFLENKLNLRNSKKLLDDLAKFQVFMLTTRDNKNKIKTQNFDFDWKNYFMNNCKLTEKNVVYSYDNLVIEPNPTKWSDKTIWYGRRSKDYKCGMSILQDKINN